MKIEKISKTGYVFNRRKKPEEKRIIELKYFLMRVNELEKERKKIKKWQFWKIFEVMWLLNRLEILKKVYKIK